MNFLVEKKQINLGPLDLNFPILKFGQGKKTIGLVIGLHGVETSGFFLVQKLFEQRNKLKNKVKVIAGANPSGLVTMSRFNGLDLPMDVKDPNRSFPGSPNGSVQGRINALILQEMPSCDLVLDIHNYSNLGGSFPILALEGIKESDFTGKLKKETLKFLQNLGMSFAFFVDCWQAEQRGFTGTFNESLNKMAVPNLCLETPSMEFLADQEIGKIVDGLLFAINGVGSAGKNDLPPPKLINTKIIKSEVAGIFTPFVKPPMEVKKGQIIGEIFNFFTLQKTAVKSPQDGLLVVIKRKNFIRVGEFLLEIGWEVGPKLENFKKVQ